MPAAIPGVEGALKRKVSVLKSKVFMWLRSGGMYKGSSNFGLLRFYYMRCKTYGDEHRETMLIKVDFYANFLKFIIHFSQHQQNQTCCGFQISEGKRCEMKHAVYRRRNVQRKGRICS